MIYATEQQVVVTAGVVVIVAAISFCLAWWCAYRRGWKQCEENQQWEQEQAKTRCTQPIWQRLAELGPVQLDPAAAEEWLTHEEQALTLANEPALEPTAVLSPEEMSWTGEIQRMTAAFEEDMARIMGGTDEQLREITR